MHNRFLLDTCTFLWLVEGNERLSTRAVQAFQDPGNAVFLSVVSGWEVALKHKLGKLPLPNLPFEFVNEKRQGLGVQSLPLEEDAISFLQRLPDTHRDPFDRILIAQALQHGLAIITPDKKISQYAVRSVW